MRRNLARACAFAAGALAATSVGTHGQTASAYLGFLDRGSGGHPHLYLTMGLRAGLGPVEVEFLHSPAEIEGTKTDLFSYRALAHARVGTFFFIVGAGYETQREWLCEDQSCADPPGPGQRFRSTSGCVTSIGAGVRLSMARVDLRREERWWSAAPIKGTWNLMIGVEVP